MAHEDQPHEQTTEDDIDFHLAIAEASGNALFNQIVVSFVPLMRISVPKAWQTRQTEDEKSDILGRHRRLAWAIANRDPDGAEKAMAAHFNGDRPPAALSAAEVTSSPSPACSCVPGRRR